MLTEIENRERKTSKKYYSAKEELNNLNKYIENLESDYKTNKEELKQDFLFNKYSNILEYLFSTKQLVNISESELIQFLQKK